MPGGDDQRGANGIRSGVASKGPLANEVQANVQAEANDDVVQEAETCNCQPYLREYSLAFQRPH